MPPFRSLKFKFFTFMLIIISILLFFLYYFTYQSNVKRLEKTFRQDLVNATKNLEDTFHVHIEDRVVQTLHFIRNLPSINRFFDAPKVEIRIHRNALERLFINLHQSNAQLIKAVSLFDRLGNEKINVVENRRNRQGRHLANAPADDSYRLMFEQLQKQQVDHVSSVYAVENEVFIVGLRLKDMFSAFNGMVVITFSISDYFDQVSHFAFKQMPVFFSLDAHLNVLRAPATHAYLLSPIPHVAMALAAKKTFIDTSQGSFIIIPFAFRNADHPMFTLAAGVSKRLHQQESKSIKNQFFIVGLLLTYIIIMLTIYFARIFIHPVIQLHNATQQIASGNLQTAVPTSFQGELGALAEAFNAMAQKLNDSNQQLISSKQYTESIIGGMFDVLIVIDQKYTIKMVNRAFMVLTAFANDAIVGQNLLALADVQSRADVPFTELLKTGYGSDVEVNFLAKDKTIIPLLMSASTFSIVDQKHIILTGKDMRDSHLVKELQVAKEAADQANQAKSDFLSQMSHELRTPLNSILGFAELLATNDEEPLSPTQQEDLSYVVKGGKTLLTLITDILDLSKIESSALEILFDQVSVPALMEDCVHSLVHMASENDVRITSVCAADYMIKADPVRLKQVVLNLLSNSIKYNKPGGQVVLKCCVAQPNRLTLTVADTGIGIPEDKQSALFEPFNRLGLENGAIEGTGIGLTITKKILTLMGSALRFKSSPEGSEFWFDLALIDVAQNDNVQPVADTLVTEVEKKPVGHVLYIEDKPSNIRLMEQIFAHYFTDIQLHSAHTPEFGVVIAQANVLQMIILDMNLPGLDGLQALQKLRSSAACRNAPIIALSAEATNMEIKKGIEKGFAHYLTEPLNIAEVVKIISALLHR